MFEITDKEIKDLENKLAIMRHKSIPFATKYVINGAARDARAGYQKEIDRDLIQRNKFTRGSIRFEQTKTLDINRQVSVVGSIAPYMGEQEFGGTKRPKGKHGVPIPTSYSAGQGRNSRPRTKLPKKPNKIRNIRIKRGRRVPVNPKQAILFKVQDAVTSGTRTFYHRFPGRSEGLFRVVGGRKKFKRGWPVGARLEMLHGMKKRSVTIPKTPMLGPAHAAAASRIPEEYKKALLFQIKRLT